MCKSSNDGGKRCDYADMVANVRKKARYKLRDAGYNTEREVEKEVQKWKQAHPDIVTAHLPEKQSFQRPGKDVTIPKNIQALLSPKARTPITGLTEKDRQENVKRLYQEHEAWLETLDKEEDRAVYGYSMYDYSFVNAHLRRRGLARLAKEDRNTVAKLTELAKARIANMDTALKKAPQTGMKTLYRYHKVPDGVSPAEYMERYFSKGEVYHEDGYMSTSGDAEFIMAHLQDRNKGTRNKNYIVMELVTEQGVSMQKRDIARSGDLQSLESEVLLPRNMEFVIHDARKSQQFTFAEDRKDLNGQYTTMGGSYDLHGKFKKGDKLSFPLVQLVDKRLTL